MTDIDVFATGLLEEAKRFLEKAKAAAGNAAEPYLHAALLLGFCSLEAHVNAISDDFIDRRELSVHERGLLLEQEVRLVEGEFELSGLRMSRLEEKIAFLHRKFSGAPLDKSAQWWGDFGNATVLRNKLTHPKQRQALTIESVERAIRSVIGAISALYQNIYGRKFPAANLDLQSQMDF